MSESEVNSSMDSVRLDALSLLRNASGPVWFVVVVLVAAATLVWFIAVLKGIQLRRLADAERRFEDEAKKHSDLQSLFVLAERSSNAPSARILLALSRRMGQPALFSSIAKRVLLDEQVRVSFLMMPLSTIAATAPFIGLFGTVYGIMDAFLRIGRLKSASLPVVAPAIGEALIATAIGLAAAIPAVVVYNALNKRIDDVLANLEVSSEGWVTLALEASVASGIREK